MLIELQTLVYGKLHKSRTVVGDGGDGGLQFVRVPGCIFLGFLRLRGHYL